jgi:hypothetical protein
MERGGRGDTQRARRKNTLKFANVIQAPDPELYFAASAAYRRVF